MLTLTASPANATGNEFGWALPTKVVVNDTPELTGTGSGTAYCPPENGVQNVSYVITDADNNTYTSPSSINFNTTDGGAFMYAAHVNFPVGIALGEASVVFSCSDSSGVTETFDPITTIVAAETTGLSVGRTHYFGSAHLESVMACPSQSNVTVYVSSSAWYQKSSIWTNNKQNAQYATTTDLSGNWSVDFALTPSTSPNPAVRVGKRLGYYTDEIENVRAMCQSQADSSIYKYDNALQFRVEADQYVAMGDSYSSGLGTDDYTLNPDCYRGFSSYAYYLTDNTQLDPPLFVACAGATTDDILWANPNVITESAQDLSLTGDTEYVTLTIGGNDAGFTDVLDGCVHHIGTSSTIGWSCASDSDITDPLDAQLAALAGTSSGAGVGPDGRNVHSISSIIGAIALKSPDAHIYIAGYPHLFGDTSSNFVSDGNAPGGYKCVVHSGTPEVSVALWDAQWINDKTDELNGIIHSAVNAATAQFPPLHVTYVSPSTFNGHGLCDSGTAWINPLTFTSGGVIPYPESFHPTVDGVNSGYGIAFANVIN
ncbi:MAG TPA: SGNH/GDSL hydrolase family protein [Candidatus Microsaccharimonas sp.]|jgi:hypothetical protein